MKKEELELLLLLLEELKRDERLIIVEGKEDRISLEELGIDGSRILEVSRKSRFDIQEVFEERKVCSVISFLDDDKAGRELLRKMKLWFPHVEFDDRYSSKLYAILHVSLAANLSKAVEKAIARYFF